MSSRCFVKETSLRCVLSMAVCRSSRNFMLPESLEELQRRLVSIILYFNSCFYFMTFKFEIEYITLQIIATQRMSKIMDGLKGAAKENSDI